MRLSRRHPEGGAAAVGRWLLAVAALALAACGRRAPEQDFVAFDARSTCAIAIAQDAGAAEQRAAEMIRDGLAKASGKSREAFPLVRVDSDELAGVDAQGRAVRRPGSTLYLRGSNHRRAGEPRLAESMAWRVTAERLEIHCYPADAIDAAAAWFLREALGARWFLPGELGESVPARAELRLPVGVRDYSPSYVSRNLGLGDAAPETIAWWHHNRLRNWFRHGHAMTSLFRTEDFQKNPEFAPLVNGLRQIPAAGDGNWQPNFLAPGAAEHAARILGQRPELSSAIGLNDSIRFDQSPAMRREVGTPKWFRQRPDYADVYFRFVNDVAQRLPGRYLGAYAYDWTENAPSFPIARNVVPYLTADRSEWFDATSAAEDQALIRRWVASGAEAVGLYDYYYGAPFLVPRPTLYAVAQSIPFAHLAGVRGFYAEVYANWGLDGPKSWLAAELLWDAVAKPADLLDIYYREYWREAGGPMREFFALCDAQWQQQPKPAYWIKYYKDEHQHLLFPPAVRARLRELLTTAQQNAITDLTRRRVEFTAGAFAVADEFCAWEEAKENLSRAALTGTPDTTALIAAWRELDIREAALKKVHAQVSKATPLAVKATILGEYERNDPRLRAAWRLRAAGVKSAVVNLEPTDVEQLRDAGLLQTTVRPPASSFDLEWVQAGPWRGHGEPYETRQVELHRAAERGELVMRGCKQETFSQLVPAEPGQLYVARVRVRGKVSPGNMTFLILNFQDAEGKALGLGAVDRLPVGNYADGVELIVWARAPKEAARVGLGVRALNQVNDDFAALGNFSLRKAEPKG